MHNGDWQRQGDYHSGQQHYSQQHPQDPSQPDDMGQPNMDPAMSETGQQMNLPQSQGSQDPSMELRPGQHIRFLDVESGQWLEGTLDVRVSSEWRVRCGMYNLRWVHESNIRPIQKNAPQAPSHHGPPSAYASPSPSVHSMQNQMPNNRGQHGYNQHGGMRPQNGYNNGYQRNQQQLNPYAQEHNGRPPHMQQNAQSPAHFNPHMGYQNHPMHGHRGQQPMLNSGRGPMYGQRPQHPGHNPNMNGGSWYNRGGGGYNYGGGYNPQYQPPRHQQQRGYNQHHRGGRHGYNNRHHQNYQSDTRSNYSGVDDDTMPSHSRPASTAPSISGRSVNTQNTNASSMLPGLPAAPSFKQDRYRVHQPRNNQADGTPMHQITEDDANFHHPGAISQPLMQEVMNTNVAATRELEDIEENLGADFEGPPQESVLPGENRLPLNTNFYHLNVDVEKLIQSLIIYQMKTDDGEVPVGKETTAVSVSVTKPGREGHDDHSSLTTLLRTRRFAEQFRAVKRHFDDVTLVPPKWLYSRAPRKQPLTLKLGETKVTIFPLQDCTNMDISPLQQAVLVERYLQDKMREAGNICYRGDWVNKSAPETVLEAARVHKSKSAPDFDYGIRRACRLSVKTLGAGGGFALCCSPSSIVRERVPVMTVLQRLQQVVPNKTDYIRLVREQLNGCRVVSTHDPDKPTYHRLQIDHNMSPKSVFTYDEKEITYAEYFRTRYKRPLKLDQPMHTEGGKALPTQYLHRTGSSHASPKMRQAIQRKCQQWAKDGLPDQLITQVNHLLEMDKIPIFIGDTIKANGFHLESLRIIGLTKFTDTRSFYEMGSHFIKPVSQVEALRRWVILHTMNTRKEALKAIAIIKRKKQKERWSDTFIGQPILVEVMSLEDRDGIERKLAPYQRCDGILCILEGQRRIRSATKARLTFLFEGEKSRISTTCQFIDVETIRRSKAAVQNVVNPQLIYKSPRDVTLWDVQVDEHVGALREIDFRNNFVAFGNDICHFDTNTGRLYPSVAALAMDMDPLLARRASCRTKTALLLPRKLIQQLNMNLYDLIPPTFLKQMLKELLEEFRECKGHYPQYHAYYFDSPAGHPIDAIKSLYIPTIKAACQELGIQDVRIVVIMVNKRPLQRLFCQFSGIIVDSVITNAEHREFLMKKYTPIPTSNIVVYDEWNVYATPQRTSAFYYVNYAMTFSYGPHDKSRRDPVNPDEEEAEGIAVQACLKYADHAARWQGEIILPTHHHLHDLGFDPRLHRPLVLVPPHAQDDCNYTWEQGPKGVGEMMPAGATAPPQGQERPRGTGAPVVSSDGLKPPSTI